MGTRDGSIIATIITTHMPRNDAAAPGHVCPPIRIHATDIDQPPGIGTDEQQAGRSQSRTVAADATRKVAAHAATKPHCRAGSTRLSLAIFGIMTPSVHPFRSSHHFRLEPDA